MSDFHEGTQQTTDPGLQAILDSEPVVHGSVQDLYAAEMGGKDLLISQATDAGSVFDVGSFFEVPGSGISRNTLRHQIYRGLGDPETWRSEVAREDFTQVFTDPTITNRLMTSKAYANAQRRGLQTHHAGIINRATADIELDRDTEVRSDLVLIERFPVIKPNQTTLYGSTVFDYSEYLAADRKIMALEHIVRLGSPAGSSLQDRYERLAEAGDTDAAKELLKPFGVEPPLERWSRLPNAVFDWTTKYEDMDRPVSRQEMLNISGTNAEVMAEVIDTLALATVYANKFFAERGLFMWDGKWEVGLDGSLVVIADTFDHDSIRITTEIEASPDTRVHVHFNKQAIRDYYRILHPQWHQAINDAKKRSKEPGVSGTFMEVYQFGVDVGEYPPIPELDPVFAELQGLKYDFVTGLTNGQTATDLGKEELEYYLAKGKLDVFLQNNGVRT